MLREAVNYAQICVEIMIRTLVEKLLRGDGTLDGFLYSRF